jgi:hypothetical protein
MKGVKVMDIGLLKEIVWEKYDLVKSELNERQIRLWSAAEAISIGFGGVKIVHEATGISRPCIIKGKYELQNGETLEKGRIRKPGGGRKKLSHQQEIEAALDTIIEPTAKGNPMSPLRWTTHSTRNLTEMLKEMGFEVSHTLVRHTLIDMNYRLSCNRKTREGGCHPDRNEQFEFINEEVKGFQQRNCPVISVDAKKKELIGNFRNPGRVWRPKGDYEMVKVYDFIDKELGKATPYGIYDLGKNIGYVNVGIDHDTAEFAVESIRRWWNQLGREMYPDAKELLITADGGGSNGSRCGLWKYCLQEFCNESGLGITVSHFPPGTSKWNKIEHRLFNHISNNWKGHPLESLEVILELIGNTKSRKGLKVYAAEDRNIYPTGRKVSKQELSELNLNPNEKFGCWNYSIKPK